MSNLTFQTHLSQPQRIHDNLESIIQGLLAVSSSTFTDPQGLDNASTAQRANKLVNMVVNMISPAGGEVGVLLTVDDVSFLPPAPISFGLVFSGTGDSISAVLAINGDITAAAALPQAGQYVGNFSYYVQG